MPGQADVWCHPSNGRMFCSLIQDQCTGDGHQRQEGMQDPVPPLHCFSLSWDNTHGTDTKREKVAGTGLGRPSVAAGSSRHVCGGGCSYAVPLPCCRKTARRAKTAKGWHSSSMSYGAGRHSSQWWPCSAPLSHVRRPARPCDRAHSTQSVK